MTHLNISPDSEKMSHIDASTAKDLLIEIGTEELPAKGLEILSEAFAQRISILLEKAKLKFTHIKSFASPRRLALLISELSTFQPDRIVVKRGPAKIQSFDSDGNPTEVLLRFAKACQVSPEKLTVQETPKGAWMILEQNEPGKLAEALLPNIVQEALNSLPLPKRMRWDNLEESFLRPVHWVVLMLGNKSIPAQYFTIETKSVTMGHRFLCKEPISLTTPQDYESILLKQGFVIADFQKRKANIYNQIQILCEKHKAQPILDDSLLEEVAGLVEWPVVMLGTFSKEFLELPKEVLITSMQNHQKCFALEDTSGKLLPNFLITSNIPSLDPGCVVNGNENVIRARLADAIFYYRKDLEMTLESRRDHLKQVIFQQGLGSLWDKSNKISKLAVEIAKDGFGKAKGIEATIKDIQRASELCKTDLLTHIVGEFPELQGVMGKYYARHDNETEMVALAIQEHYYPRFAQDILPSSLEGCAIALADRIDSLVGLFVLNKRPSGDKDPFALKRQALAVLRILIEKELKIDLEKLFQHSIETYQLNITNAPTSDFNKLFLNSTENIIPVLMDFCFERLRAFTMEQGIPVRVFDAVLENRPPSPYDFYRRLLAVNAFRSLPEAESLAEANKRVRNILSKTDIPSGQITIELLQETAEKDLFKALNDKKAEILPLMEQEHYEAALMNLASLKAPIDTFFDKVMVMVPDPKLKENRLKLLTQLRSLFLEIADISVL